MSIFAHVPRVLSRELVDGEIVRVPHIGSACYSTDASGRRWIRKRVANIGSESLLAEAVGWLVGRRLGVPIPDAAASTDADASWLSREVSDVIHWSSSHVGRISNLEDLGAMLTADVILGNDDRHARNILLEESTGGTRLRAWAIDFGNALAGTPAAFAVHRDDVPNSAQLARGLPLEALRTAAESAAALASCLPHDELAGFAAEACRVADKPKATSMLAETLQFRCQLAPALLARYLDLIEGRRP